MPHEVSSVIGSSLKTSSRPLVGVVGDDGVAGGVVGTCNSFRFSGPFFSWFELLELFFIFASTWSSRLPATGKRLTPVASSEFSDLNRGSHGTDVIWSSSRLLASLFRSVWTRPRAHSRNLLFFLSHCLSCPSLYHAVMCSPCFDLVSPRQHLRQKIWGLTTTVVRAAWFMLRGWSMMMERYRWKNLNLESNWR